MPEEQQGTRHGPGGPDYSRRARPNLFIVGAAKSGTTALATFLGEHPDVFMAPWELNYFGSDLDFRDGSGRRWRMPIEHYLGAFAYRHGFRYRGDHSVFYLYSTTAASEIKDWDADARIIVMLRNPVDQMESQHSEMLYQGDEDIADFEQALAAEAERREGTRIPAGCRKPFALQYRDLARYADQLERYTSAFGDDRVLVLLHDDLIADAASCYRRVLGFLGLDPDYEPQLRVVNPNKTVRWSKLRDLLRDTSPSQSQQLRRLGRVLVRNDRSRARLRRRLQSINTKSVPRPPMDPELRRRLQAELADDIGRLETMLDRDLSNWLGQVGSGTR